MGLISSLEMGKVFEFQIIQTTWIEVAIIRLADTVDSLKVLDDILERSRRLNETGLAVLLPNSLHPESFTGFDVSDQA